MRKANFQTVLILVVKTVLIYLQCNYLEGVDFMLRKVFNSGKSTVVSLPKDFMELLGLKDGSDVSVELDRELGQIIIRPVEQPIAAVGVDEDFAHQVSEFIAEYRPALNSLAK
jgi:antitoxin MazE